MIRLVRMLVATYDTADRSSQSCHVAVVTSLHGTSSHRVRHTLIRFQTIFHSLQHRSSTSRISPAAPRFPHFLHRPLRSRDAWLNLHKLIFGKNLWSWREVGDDWSALSLSACPSITTCPLAVTRRLSTDDSPQDNDDSHTQMLIDRSFTTSFRYVYMMNNTTCRSEQLYKINACVLF